ncbi:MAG: hypothetical protein HYW00_02395 [Candidatus Colwellbacteria bacterium]|nr:hypothetical protein [Candidatus Colwellbacteria bacterium]
MRYNQSSQASLIRLFFVVSTIALFLISANYAQAASVSDNDFKSATYKITSFEGNCPKTIETTIAGVKYTFTDNNPCDSNNNFKAAGNTGFICSQKGATAGINLTESSNRLEKEAYYNGYITLNYSGDTNKKCDDNAAQKFLPRTEITAYSEGVVTIPKQPPSEGGGGSTDTGGNNRGTYSCVWGGKEVGCFLNTNPGGVNCEQGYYPENCAAFGEKQCSEPAIKSCVRAFSDTPKQDNTYSCVWGGEDKGCLLNTNLGAYKCKKGYIPEVNCASSALQNSESCSNPPKRNCVTPAEAGGSADTGGSTDVGGSGDVSKKFFQIQNPLKFGTIPEILKEVSTFLFNIALAFVTIMVLWGGLQILTAAGSPQQIDKGKQTLLWAIIGTVVILIAGGVADLIGNILGGKAPPS